METILFSGAHGVGKGFFLDKIKKDIQGYKIYSASDLIKRYKNATDAGYKKVSDIDDNQNVLINAINEIKKDNRNIILDGHLCVFNANGEVERIPESFFVDAEITEIIILQDEPSKICERIQKRDSNVIEIQDIEFMQFEELRYARELEAKFHIRYEIVTHECTKEQFIYKFIYRGGEHHE